MNSIRMLGPINGITPKGDIDTEDNVIFVGKESDYQEGIITTFISRVKVNIEGTKYPFSDIFQIESRAFRYFGKFAKSGDSGAWVIRDEDHGRDHVCGLLFAGNGNSALCCFFENVMENLETVSNLKLRLLP